MTVAPTACPHCHTIHATDWAVAVDRWRPEGPAGYRARYPDAPWRATRAEAIADMCARYAVLPPGCTCPDERHIPDKQISAIGVPRDQHSADEAQISHNSDITDEQPGQLS